MEAVYGLNDSTHCHCHSHGFKRGVKQLSKRINEVLINDMVMAFKHKCMAYVL